jgi:hypothetical protein
MSKSKKSRADPDLPGDKDFLPAPSVLIENGMVVNVIPLPLADQQAIHHNQLRYAELGRLRSGRANLYEQSSYR